jgi:O-antigen/teichoic acid export membrane protein
MSIIDKVKQKNGVFFILVSFVALPIALASNILSAKYLGATNFGDFRFLISLFTMFCTISTLGFFQALARAIVLETSGDKIREIYGSAVFFLSLIYLLVVSFLFVYLSIDTNIEKKELESYVFLILPFGWVLLARNFFETTLPAHEKINLLSVVRIFQPLVFFSFLFLIYWLDDHFLKDRLFVYICVFFFSFMVSYFFITKSLRLKFSNIKSSLVLVIEKNKEFGFNVYLGSVFPIAFASLSEILISYFSENNSNVGFYALALSICAVVTVVPRCMGSIRYKSFSVDGFMKRADIYWTLGVGLLVTVIMIVSIKPFISLAFDDEFYPVIDLVYILSFGLFFHGLGDFLNRFVVANGYGKIIRNSSFITGFTLLVFNSTLIPAFGMYGAALATSLVGVVYFILMFFCAKRVYYIS